MIVKEKCPICNAEVKIEVIFTDTVNLLSLLFVTSSCKVAAYNCKCSVTKLQIDTVYTQATVKALEFRQKVEDNARNN